MYLNLYLFFFSTCGFAYFLKCPRKTLLAVFFNGAVEFIVTKLLETYCSFGSLESFLGTLALGFLAAFFSRKYKVPTTVFFQAGVIPLVPGRAIYEMMYNLVYHDYDKAMTSGLEGLFIAALISLGIYITSYISDLTKGALEKMTKKNRR